jgi:hypothetical protein
MVFLPRKCVNNSGAERLQQKWRQARYAEDATKPPVSERAF